MFPFKTHKVEIKSAEGIDGTNNTKITVELTGTTQLLKLNAFTDNDTLDTDIKDSNFLQNYKLARDKEKRIINPPLMQEL